MSTLICGSMAYDTIMVFHDHFKHHILPEKIHILNVAFLVPEMRREFGGTAGNIAYNLHGLGGDARIMATVGDDFGPYRERLQALGLRGQGGHAQQHRQGIGVRGGAVGRGEIGHHAPKGRKNQATPAPGAPARRLQG